MTLRDTSQQKSSVTRHISEILSRLNDLHSINTSRVAELTGVNRATLYRAIKGKGGSLQLLRALEMLLELQTRKPFHWPDEAAREEAEALAAGAGMSVEDFAAQCALRHGKEVVAELLIERSAGGRGRDAELIRLAGVALNEAPLPKELAAKVQAVEEEIVRYRIARVKKEKGHP